MKLYFYGGVGGSVTGANYLIECGGAKVLVDCGLRQGGRLAEHENYEPFPYDPGEISAVVITHAHLDHVGLIPKLYRDGFRGRIFATHPTLDLARLNLDDSLHLLKKEAEEVKELETKKKEPVKKKSDSFALIDAIGNRDIKKAV
ncbi:MAG: MBL fold metallo-hydrolase, partial [Patescibacteria group bacterium]